MGVRCFLSTLHGESAIERGDRECISSLSVPRCMKSAPKQRSDPSPQESTAVITAPVNFLYHLDDDSLAINGVYVSSHVLKSLGTSSGKWVGIEFLGSNEKSNVSTVLQVWLHRACSKDTPAILHKLWSPNSLHTSHTKYRQIRVHKDNSRSMITFRIFLYLYLLF